MFVDQYVGGRGVTANGQVVNGSVSAGSPMSMFGGGRGMHWEAGLRRPYIQNHPRLGDRFVVDIRTGRTTLNKGVQTPIFETVTVNELARRGIYLPVPVNNATTLRKEEWIELDRQVLRAARYRMRVYADVAKANSFGGFNGMAKLILEHETMSDPGEAIVDMNGITDGRGDTPLFQLQGLPLPITHADFWYDQRRLAVSRNSGTPLDMTMGEACGRRVAEMIEKTTIGITTGVIYGGASTYVGGYGRTSQVYGITTFPARLTKTNMYRPTGNGRSGTGWVPADTLKDVLAILDQLRANKFYGPWMIYTSNDWDQYMDADYILTGGNVTTQTLRQRLMKIGEGDDYGRQILGVKRADFLFSSSPAASTGPGGESLASTYPFTLLFVQMTPDVIRAVNGMDITTVQWETKGGMQLNFKVMTIQVPQIRADYYNNCGIEQADCSASPA